MLNRKLHLIFITLLLLSISTATNAQIEIVPIEYNHAIANTSPKQVLFRKALRLDTLPFVEDFASIGPFPNPNLWEDNSVFVNATLAKNPPSLGVATFDGLDNTGTPYRINGAGDTLTSVPINLDISNPNNLFLSYFVQQAGFGDKPESSDSLILEFKTDLGDWVPIRTYIGTDSGSLPDSLEGFSFESVQISALRFLNEDFQFRFRNTSSGRGAVDLWHLDVVRIINNQVPSLTYQDLAFQFPTQSILNRYSAMPTKHFKSNTNSHLRDEFTFNIFNHLDVGRSPGGPNSVMSITELTTGLEVVSPQQFLSGADLNIDPATNKEFQSNNSFNINSNIFDEEDDLQFESLFIINPTQADNDPGLLDNNFLRRTTNISNYFAYDDGTAEFGIQAKGSGTQVATEFQTSVADTLSSIQILFPHIKGDISFQNFNLKVWIGSLDTEPVYEGSLLNPIYVDSFADTLQGFTTYRLEDTFTGELMAVELEANTTFFVGWEQVSVEFEDAIPVGFDVSTPGVAQYNHLFRPGYGWSTFEEENFDGAVMIRPVMGVENAIFTAVDNQAEQNYKLYPNPSRGEIRIENTTKENLNAQLDVFDIQGRMVHSQSYQELIDLNYLPDGVYFITLTDSNNTNIFREKLIIQAN
jgi:hypothetical protein